MAGHDDSGSSEKKSSEAMNDAPTFNAENMQNNMKSVYYSRTFMSIIGGVIAGILGFTSLTGFIFFFLVMAITSVGLIAKAGFSIHSFFDSWIQIILDGILGGLMSFVLFWTIPMAGLVAPGALDFSQNLLMTWCMYSKLISAYEEMGRHIFSF